MKKLPLFIVLLLLSCQKPKVTDNDKFIIGKWTMFETIEFQNNDDSVAMVCNSCPEITFVKNHSGFIKRPHKILFYFDWKFDESKLVIEQTDLKLTDNILNAGAYKISYANKRQFREVALSDSVKNLKYILRR